MASCNFTVGMKVVCVRVKETPPPNIVLLGKVILPEVGKIYTVRSVKPSAINDDVCIQLEEIDLQIVAAVVDGRIGLGTVAFEHDFFRPVVERKTDISIFRAMMNKTPEQVPA